MSDPSPIQFSNFQPHRHGRARTKERGHGELLKALTLNLVDTYSVCSSAFKYTQQLAPRRVLTKLSRGVHNGGYDNAEHDYICRVGDLMVNPDQHTYEIVERLGHGTFGQVLKCINKGANQKTVALKIIKNKPAYFHQALVEVHILQKLNSKYDPDDECRIVRMLDFFVYRKHLCIAFELMSVNLYDVLKQNNFRGVSMALIRVLTEQLLKALLCLRAASVIHCDLKPENVLLSDMQHTRIKLIDFGSACFENHTVYSYIQSRFYRSPEVLLGLPYTTAVDMWSLGCICSELFLGLPIFPGHSEYDQVCRVAEVQGLPPAQMLDLGKNTCKYFKRDEDSLQQHPSRGEKDVASDRSNDKSGSGDRSPRGENDSQKETHLQAESRRQNDPPPSGQLEVANKCPEENASTASTMPESSNDATATAESTDRFPTVAFGSPKVDSEKKLDLVDEASIQGETDTSVNAHNKESLLDLIKRKLRSAPVPIPSSDNGEAVVTSDGEVDLARGHDSEASTAAPASQRRAPDSGEDARAEKKPNASLDAQGEDGQHKQRAARQSRSKRRRVRAPWRLKMREEYERDEHKKEPTPKKYFDFKSLHKMVESLPYKSNLSRRAKAEEKDRRKCFLQFLWGVMALNPDERWTPKQATLHSFVAGHSFDPDFQVPEDEMVPSFTKPQQVVKSLVLTAAIGRTGTGDVPPLPVDAIPGGSIVGGGSARTWSESRHAQGGVSGSSDTEQPRSAPASTRGSHATAHGNVDKMLVCFISGGVDRGAVCNGRYEQFGTYKGRAMFQNMQSPAIVYFRDFWKVNFKHNTDGWLYASPDAKGQNPPTGHWTTHGYDGKDAGTEIHVRVDQAQPHSGLDIPTIPSSTALRGLWGQLYQGGVPLPDETTAESYRPPIEQLPDDFFRVSPRSAIKAHQAAASVASTKTGAGEQASLESSNRARSGAASISISSVSSTGSTPTQTNDRGRQSQGLRSSSPLSGGSHGTRGHRKIITPGSVSTDQSKDAGRGKGSAGNATLASSASDGSVQALSTRRATSGTPNSTTNPPQGPQPGTVGGHGRVGACTVGSRDGSRGSSPWHLPSPMSELSTASDRIFSSQPSGSDSCGENSLQHVGGTQSHYSFDEYHFSGEDHSQSDSHWRSQQPSDSDGALTPQSHDTSGNSRAEERERPKDPQIALWENIQSEMARVQLSRDRLPRRADTAQSPGSASTMANFREKMGINESGPVIPSGHSARRDGSNQVLGNLGTSQSAGSVSARHIRTRSGGFGAPGNSTQ